MRLFSASACPYAHRTRALLTLLGAPFELREIDLSNKPADFLALSPTGAVPLLEDDGFVLYESAVINEYLAERLAWRDAYASDLRQRALERLAMKRFDDLLLPLAFASFSTPASIESKPLWRREVEFLSKAVTGSQPSSLLGLHLATHWVRMSRAFPGNVVVAALRDALGGFLDAAAALPCVVATSPDLEAAVSAMRARFGPKPQA
ncbi:MAG: glutathione S-transferase [Myxococcaceae bacterium]|nr:glutathione S-transferase [Myxococcaceae bacterium]